MPDSVLQPFLESQRGVVIAPAGCGKTELVAKAVAESRGGPHLVLTHTHAGVRALRQRLLKFTVSPRKAHVETIAGWALRYASAFPTLSAIGQADPTHTDFSWKELYRAAGKCLHKRTVQQIVLSSYDSVFVDEYQDCTQAQHYLILAVACLLPCRIVGDPLQGIFDFRKGDPIVDWNEQVLGNFAFVGQMETPWRWKGHNEPLGEWLAFARHKIILGEEIDLSSAPLRISTFRDSSEEMEIKTGECYRMLKYQDQSAVAILSIENKCHHLAKRLGGHFCSMEPIDCKDLFQAAEKFQGCRGNDLAMDIIDFAAKCLTKVRPELKRIREKLDQGASPNRLRKYARIRNALTSVARTGDFREIDQALVAIREDVKDSVLYRRELWNEMRKSLKAHTINPDTSLRETAWTIRDQGRRFGRKVDLRTVSRTFLVKGLEFHNAIVVDDEDFNAKNLYVAITRGSKSLTIISKEPRIRKDKPMHLGPAIMKPK